MMASIYVSGQKWNPSWPLPKNKIKLKVVFCVFTSTNGVTPFQVLIWILVSSLTSALIYMSGWVYAVLFVKGWFLCYYLCHSLCAQLIGLLAGRSSIGDRPWSWGPRLNTYNAYLFPNQKSVPKGGSYTRYCRELVNSASR
jgi:hypothetical protein